MADEARKISNSPSPLENVDDLPLPPPLPISSRPLGYEGPLALSSLPVPPPKETFSTFYQKQQRNELKRIIKHVDPHLQFKLSDAEDDEITKAIQSENSSAAEAAYQGDVQSMRWIFENWNLDNIGEPRAAVKTLDDEELTGGDVRGTSLAFKHLDSNQQILAKRQISHSGDVRTSTWLFETRPLDSLSKSESEEGELVVAVLREPIQPGDVTGTRLLFESKPLSELGRHKSNEDNLLLNPKSEREECKDDGILGEVKSVGREKANGGNVNHVRRLYETQPLNGINKESDEKSQTLALEEGPSGGVEQKRLMFDTQPFDTIQHNVELENFEPSVAECASNVSQVKELFTFQSLNEIGSEITTSSDDQIQREMSLTDQETDDKNSHKATDAERSNVHDKKSIFETFSLDKINQEPIEQSSVEAEEPVSKVDVKSSTMMFESMPMYAIRDKEGEFHEVTTLKKEEVTSGDVRKARWMFETKPLDAIRAENDVYVIRAVTQEERQKGDVKSARWKFETQPLDSITSHEEPFVKVTEDPGSGSGQLADRHTLESKQSSKQFVRTASVTDIQSGRVRTSTWLFENQPIESLKGEPEQQVPLKAVQRQDSRRGDVKRCTWLFESQPLEKIKETGESSRSTVEGKLPCSNVKSTTWLFETTPLDKINVGSATDSLSSLHQMSHVHSNGILIEASENKNLIMVKYQVDNDEDVQIQKEEVIAGDIRNTMLQLLQSTTPNPQVILLREVEEGKFSKTVVQSPGCQFATTTSAGNDRVQNIIQMIDEMLVQEKALKKGILMQVTEDGQAELSVYSLIGNNGTESPIVERGDVKSAIGNLFSSANGQRVSPSCRVDETEKGNVSLYKNVIEKEDEVGHSSKEQIPVVKGDVEEAKRSLCQQKDQIEKTVCDVLPGDVQNTKKIFSSNYSFSVDNCIPKEEIIPGDVSSAKQQLAVRPAVEVEKEEIIAGNIKDAMQSLELAKQQSVCIGREPIKPGTIYDMDQSAQGPDVEEIPVQKEVIISGDIKAAKRSLEMAKQQSMHTERKTVVPGDIYNLCASAQDNSSSTGCPSASRCQQVKAVPKVSSAAKDKDKEGVVRGNAHLTQNRD